jgi:transposase-like protein
MRAPALAVGDGALGFWSAVRAVWPETQAQHDWVHRIVNVLDTLPKRLQGMAKAALKKIMNAPSRAAAEQEIARFRPHPHEQSDRVGFRHGPSAAAGHERSGQGPRTR